MTMLMKERAIGIGKPVPLAGVITLPNTLDSIKPAILLFNSGVMHHAGACRLTVKLARLLAEQGFLSIRFDFSGIGDSAPRSGSLSFTQSAPQEAKEVMDYLQKKYNVQQFILYGLCSGADAAYETALADDRVVGIVQIDPYCYKNWKYHLHHYSRRVFKWQHWKSFFLRSFGLKQTTNEISPHDAIGVDKEYYEMASYARQFPSPESVKGGINTLMRRKVNVLSIFTGGTVEYNYQGQFFDTFGAVIDRQYYHEEHYPEAGHIIAQPDSQAVVLRRITEWLR